jgi:hypothetical protein
MYAAGLIDSVFQGLAGAVDWPAAVMSTQENDIKRINRLIIAP